VAVTPASPPRLRQLPTQMLATAPAPALVIGGLVGSDVGSAIAKHLLDLTGAATTAGVRLLFTGVLALMIWRPALRFDRRTLAAIAGLGASIAGMNICFYEAIGRIPLGTVVTIDFLGPLAVALIHSRRLLDAAWAAPAAAGVVLLTWSGGPLSWTGVLFALGSAACYGCYVPCSAVVGERTSGHDGLALAMIFGALLSVPIVFAHADVLLSKPMAPLYGLGIALLASLVPFLIELEALRRMPTSTFSLLTSADPAVAAAVGFLLLGQALRIFQWAGIGLVVVATAGSTWTTRSATAEPCAGSGQPQRTRWDLPGRARTEVARRWRAETELGPIRPWLAVE